MNYIKTVFNHGLKFLNNRLSKFEKIIYFVLIVLLIIVTIISLIEVYPDYFVLLLGCILFLSGIYLFLTRFVRHQVVNFKNRKNSAKNYNKINTNGGNYNEFIQGNYIQGDYIIIQNKRIDISKDVTQILGEFKNILTKLINQGCSVEEAVIKLANDLANEARRKPEIKSKLFIDDDANDQEVQEEFINLLINDYLLKNKTPFLSNYDEEKSSSDYEERINYKGYTIHLETDKDGWWHYKIDGFLYNKTGESFSKYFAIDEAKGKIDEQRFSNW
ncbi:hypothetical protein [Nodularia sphaerocarpa]|uniref:hypothetical protein n=1 Tax=Nodularia sphaerocarpa TaxID=137816 RepID=UPI001EFBFA5D|nr:hypothetical protein [Nodularia sphaerocarpa]MDB9372905.1 hypothetical protein [Nodularia sphaerocarpa CS-585]MDB9377650.1 hypothetical protein [Nodularia sphaerocarpa CS-585A2]ULP71643.1 hypothetical protein BDGGKGIB_01274 [Nodularia sphaerocarpa UHCC 0038]